VETVHVTNLIITNYCDLSSVVKSNAVRHSLSSCVSDSWLIKESQSLKELFCDTFLKIKFEALSLPEFWIYV
jgi:hypothetical protein